MKMYNSYVAHQRKKMHQMQQAPQQPPNVKQKPETATSYHLRKIREWCCTQPAAICATGLPLELITAAAFANETRRPSMRHAAAALKACGWVQRRDYRNAAGGRRYWFRAE